MGVLTLSSIGRLPRRVIIIVVTIIITTILHCIFQQQLGVLRLSSSMALQHRVESLLHGEQAGEACFAIHGGDRGA